MRDVMTEKSSGLLFCCVECNCDVFLRFVSFWFSVWFGLVWSGRRPIYAQLDGQPGCLGILASYSKQFNTNLKILILGLKRSNGS